MMGKKREIVEKVKNLGEQRLAGALLSDKYREGAERHRAGLYRAKRPADNSERIDGFAAHKGAILQLHDDRARTRVRLFAIDSQPILGRASFEQPVWAVAIS